MENQDPLTFPVYEFAYNTTNLPPRNSHQVDHWGFYNSNTYLSKIPAVPGIPELVTGADKSPDASRSKANILTKITYATGGYSSFEYEGHQYFDTGTNNNTSAGGVRIHRIRDNAESAENEIIRTFNYTQENLSNSSGSLFNAKPIYHYKRLNGFGSGGYEILYYRFSEPLDNLFDINGSHVTYNTVTINHNHGGKEMYKFHDYISNPIIVPGFKKIVNDNITSRNGDGLPYQSGALNDWERGLLKEKKVLDVNGETKFEIKNHYQLSSVDSKKVRGLRVLPNAQPSSFDNIFYFLQYDEVHTIPRLQWTEETIYDQTNPSRSVTNRIDYTYDASYPSLVKSEIETRNSSSESRTRKYYYAFDYITNPLNTFDISEAIIEMQDDHIIAVPVETQAWIDYGQGDKLAEIIIDAPRLSHGRVKPYQQYILKDQRGVAGYTRSYIHQFLGAFIKDSKFFTSITYDSYDTYGNLLTATARDGRSYQLEWGYNNALLTDFVINPNPDDEHRTVFEHEKLVGLTQINDPNSIKTRFSYDDLRRLKLIKDDDQNITTRFRYHLKSDPSPRFTIGRTGRHVVDYDILFSVRSTASIGETKYSWDFGDGNVIHTTDHGVNHTYTSVGTFTVTLVAMNPEFDPEVVTQTVTILPPLSLDRSDLSFPYTGGTKTVNVESPAGAYTVSENIEWATITNITNSSFKVRCISNSGNVNGRTGAITVSNPRATLTVTVIQDEDPLGEEGVYCPEGCVWNTTLQKCLPLAVGGFCAEE